MLDSIYHMTLKLTKTLIIGVKTSMFCHLLRNVIMDVAIDISPSAFVSCFQCEFKLSCFLRDLPKSLLISKVSPFDFEYYVILIYRVKVSDRGCDVKVTFVFNRSFVGVSVFSLLKK